jgi:DMSO/TMAO reductase YedYZ molybdopterin-dependent catalytic subunit
MPGELTDEREYLEERRERLAAATSSGGVSRRRLLQLAAAGVPLVGSLGAAGRAVAGPGDPAPPPPIRKPTPPEWFVALGTNAEMRWDAAGDLGYTVPNERFFVRNHTSTPTIDAATWRLRIEGPALRTGPVAFTYPELLRLHGREITAFVECAGNGRSLFASQQGAPTAGTAWGLGAIGVARWRGVPLSVLLDRAGVDLKRAVDVMPEGLDATVVANGVDQGHVRRPLSIGKALDDVLVALEMNGEPLPPDHGFPARLIVPGWIGVASIKWLGRIVVSDAPLTSYWNTVQYRLTGGDHPADSPPLTAQVVKSAWELPRPATLRAGVPVTLRGRSWSGHGRIRRVEVSNDGGATWHRAHLRGPDHRLAWVRWSIPWRDPRAGAYELLARATDDRGNTQPATTPLNANGYLFDAVVRHPLTVA